jgi:hypothetical protein
MNQRSAVSLQNVLREEVMEKLIWSVDRSSPSNKIRDLMKWSKDILKDIYYQRKILSSPVATFFTKQWYSHRFRPIRVNDVVKQASELLFC